MKIRMKGNSLRLRLTRSEVAELADLGTVVERVEFPNAELIYELQSSSDIGEPVASFENGGIRVVVSEAEARDWAATNRVGIATQCGPLSLLIEKDFQCLHGDQDPDAFEARPTCPPLELVPSS